MAKELLLTVETMMNDVVKVYGDDRGQITVNTERNGETIAILGFSYGDSIALSHALSEFLGDF